MAQKSLTTSYLAQLSNANHDGVSTQIYDRLVAFSTQNQMLATAIQTVGTARVNEDVAFKHNSAKDFASDDLKREDTLEDNYMSAIRGILNALLYLPEGEPMRRQAEQAVRLFKDFNYHVSAGFEAAARNVVNMVQEWTTHPDRYDLDALGIRPWVIKANEQAVKVLRLITTRVDNESAKVKGELADARKATDAAIRQTFDIINALNVLQPSTELTALINVLLSIEERAKLYYINNSSASNVRPSGGGSTPSGGDSGPQGGSDGGSTDDQGGQQGGSTPDPGTGGGSTPDPGTGGGTDNPDTPTPNPGGSTPDPDDPTNSED